MKLLNIFRNNQQAVSIAHAPETDLDEQVLAEVNGGHGSHNDCHRQRDCDDHYRRHDDCHHDYHREHGCRH